MLDIGALRDLGEVVVPEDGVEGRDRRGLLPDADARHSVAEHVNHGPHVIATDREVAPHAEDLGGLGACLGVEGEELLPEDLEVRQSLEILVLDGAVVLEDDERLGGGRGRDGEAHSGGEEGRCDAHARPRARPVPLQESLPFDLDRGAAGARRAALLLC